MFSFEVPKWACLQVNLPTGGVAGLIHIGGGRFLSRVPPIAFTGVCPTHPMQQEGLQVTWDGTTLPGNSQDAHPAVFGFDVAGASLAVEAAARAGDTFAASVLEEFAAAERMIEAQSVLREALQKPAELSEQQLTAAGVETKAYDDGTTATGVAPLPDDSPATPGGVCEDDVCTTCR